MDQFLQDLYDHVEIFCYFWYSKIVEFFIYYCFSEKIIPTTQKERLENFYGPLGDHLYDYLRAKCLHGRPKLMHACAQQMLSTPQSQKHLVWVDLGGGTASNVETMANLCDLSMFKEIYVVDLCSPLCAIAKKRVAKHGWTNVHIVEGDVCDFVPKDQALATLVTFSYSLSMIPPFMEALDKAATYLDPEFGVLGVTDFFTSLKHDKPERQTGYAARWLWRAVFDLDDVDVGPLRRQYLEYKFDTVYEENHTYFFSPVPFVRLPHFVWLGRTKQ